MDAHECRAHHLSRGPRLGMYLTPQPSGESRSSATIVSKSSPLNLVTQLVKNPPAVQETLI